MADGTKTNPVTGQVIEETTTEGWKRILNSVIDNLHGRTGHVTKENEAKTEDATSTTGGIKEPKGWDRLKVPAK